MKSTYLLWMLAGLNVFFCSCHHHAHGNHIKNDTKSNIDIRKFISKNAWDTLFPHRYGYNKNNSGKTDFYSFESFANAATHFPQFLAEGDEISEKKELAAFLAAIAYESSQEDSVTQKTDYLDWGLAVLASPYTSNNENRYDTTNNGLPSPKYANYYGRGLMQLRGYSDYQKFGEFWFDKDSILLQDPDQLITDPETAFASAIWWWTTPHGPAPSCHDVITGNWEPTMADITKGRFAGFGSVVNIISGGIKCGMGYDDKTNVRRFKFYKKFCDYLHVDTGGDISCKDAQPFGS